VVLPAAGQGALALQCRRSDPRTRELLAAMNDPVTATVVAAERAVVQGLNGDCHSPIAAWATVQDDQLTLHAAVGARDGEPPVLRAHGYGTADSAVAAVLKSLSGQNVQAILAPGR